MYPQLFVVIGIVDLLYNVKVCQHLTVFTKRFSSHTGSGGLFKLKLSKHDQSIMMFLSNYERSNFLSYFPSSNFQ